ncbi:hypothetical protein CYMTET_12723, partial [Cymbomonas tetramitiformis]
AAAGYYHTVFMTGDLSAVDAADTSLVSLPSLPSAAELGRLPASPPPAATTGAAADMPFYGVGDFYGLEEFYGLPVPPNIDAYALTPPSSSPPAHSLHPATSLATHAGGGLIAGHGAATGATARAAAPQGGAVGERRERQLREGLPARVPTPHLDPEETAALLAASPAPSAPTQRFTAAAPFDLAGRALVFAPRGVTTYQTCLEDNLPSGAPASPAASPGATHVDFDGDGVFSQSVQLSAPFHFFGRGYAEMRVEASGRLTFGAGAGKRAGAAATWPPLGVLDAHLATPGISALLVAAAEVPAGVACWHEEVDPGTAEARLLVTWQLPGDGREGLGGFTAQAALHLGTGRIRLAWAGSWEARAAELVVGLSAGPELAHVPQSDLSASPWCAAPGSSDGADDERGGVGDADSGAAASAQAHTLAPRPSGSRRRADRGRAARRRTEERRAAAAAALAANSPFKELFSGLGGAKASPSPSPSLHGDAQHSDVHDLTRRLIVRAEQLADDVAAAAGESPGGSAEDPISRAGSLYRGGRRSGAEGEGSAGAYYYPHGVQREVPEEVVTGGGWELCYDGLESLKAAAGGQYYFANCEGEHILLAARGSVDSKNALLLLAAGRRAEVLRETHSEEAAEEHNGAFWYNVRGRSVGFAPSSAVSLQLMDVRHRYTQCEGRLSWRVVGLGHASAGGRAGCATWNAAAGEWRKVAYHRADRIHLPSEPTWADTRESTALSGGIIASSSFPSSPDMASHFVQDPFHISCQAGQGNATDSNAQFSHPGTEAVHNIDGCALECYFMRVCESFDYSSETSVADPDAPVCRLYQGKQSTAGLQRADVSKGGDTWQHCTLSRVLTRPSEHTTNREDLVPPTGAIGRAASSTAVYCQDRAVYKNDVWYAWASPCSGGCSTITFRGSWRYCTSAEFDNRPSKSEFINGQYDTGYFQKCAAPCFDNTYQHCDRSDAFVRFPDGSYYEQLICHDAGDQFGMGAPPATLGNAIGRPPSPPPRPPSPPATPPFEFYGLYGLYGFALPVSSTLDGLGVSRRFEVGEKGMKPLPGALQNDLPRGLHRPSRCAGASVGRASGIQTRAVDAAPTQVFSRGQSDPSDLTHSSLAFSPSSTAGSNATYDMCFQPRADCQGGLPDPPSTQATIMEFLDDGRHVIELNSTFPFFNEAYQKIAIGDSGDLIFTHSTTVVEEYNTSLAYHFAVPRIAVLYSDLGTTQRGSVKHETLGEGGTPSERLVVTWERVPEHYNTGANHFQVALYLTTGDIQLSWAEVTASWALVGLSPGGGAPSNFTQMAFTQAPSCATSGGLTYVDHHLHHFTGQMPETVRLPVDGVASNGNAPRSIVLRLRTAATEDYCVVSTGTAAENRSFSVMSYGSQGRCIGVMGYLNDFHPGYRGYPAHCTPVNDGAWHHVAVTYDGEGKLVVYVDGMEDNHAEGRAYGTAGQENFLGRSNDEHYPDLLVGGHAASDWLVLGDADKVLWREFYGLSGIRGDEAVSGNGGSWGWPRHSPGSDLEDAEQDAGSRMYDATGGFYGVSHEMAERYRTPSPPTGAPPHPHLMWDHAPPWWYEHGLPHPPVPAPVQVEVLPGDALAAVTLRPGESFLQEIEVVNRGDRAVQFGVQVEYWAVLLEGVEADGTRGSAALAPREVGRFRQVVAVWRGGWWGCGREASCGHLPSPDWPWQACKHNCDGVRRPFSFELLKNGEHVLEQPAWGTLPLQCATPANATDDIICDVDLIIAEGDTLTVSWYGASHAAPSALESPSHSRREDADHGTLRLDLLAIPSPPPAFSNPPRGAGGGVRRLLTSTPTATTTPTAANTVAPTTSHHHTAHPTTHSPTATIPTAAPTAGLAPPTAAPTTAAPAADSTVASPLDFPTASPTPAPTTAAPAASPTTDFAIDGPTSAPSTAPKGSPSSPPTVPSTAGPTSATSPTMPPPEGPLTLDEAGIASPVLLLDGSSQEVARGVAQAEESALITLNHSSADLRAALGSRRITLRIFPAGSSARDVVLGLPAAVRVHQHVVNASCGLAAPAASSASLEAALRIIAFHDNLSAVPPATGGPRGIYWGGAAQGVRFQLEVAFSTSPGIEAEELASLLEVTNGDVLHSRESEACRGLQADVVGWVHLADPWRQNHTAVRVQMPDTQSSTEAVYGHRPVAELFAMDTVAMEHGHCTSKRDALLIVMFSEPVIGFDVDALEFGPGIHPLVSKAISGTTASYHVYVGFNESFVGHTFVRLRSEAVEDHQGAPNLPTAKLELTRVNFLPFSQLASYHLNASNPYILAP